jgi:hypothetical protein
MITELNKDDYAVPEKLNNIPADYKLQNWES